MGGSVRWVRGCLWVRFVGGVGVVGVDAGAGFRSRLVRASLSTFVSLGVVGVLAIDRGSGSSTCARSRSGCQAICLGFG